MSATDGPPPPPPDPTDLPARLIRGHGYKVYALIFLLNLFWSGFSAVTLTSLKQVDALAEMAARPFEFHYEGNYYQEAPLFLILAHTVGAVTRRKYLLFCLAMIATAHASVLGLAVRKLGKPRGVTAALLFLAHPVTYILHTWIGMFDPLTVACTAVLLFARGVVPVLLAAVVATMNHPSTAFIVPALMAIRLLDRPRNATPASLAAGLGGVVAGKVFLALTQRLYPFPVYTRWHYFRDVPFHHWLVVNFSYFSLAVYSFAFALWAPLTAAILARHATARRLTVAFVVSIAGLYGVTFLTLDTTRVFAILTWAPTLYYLSSSERDPTPGLGRLIRWTALLGWLAPHLFVWDTKLYAASVRDMLLLVRAFLHP
jgi:hypothetical protein